MILIGDPPASKVIPARRPGREAECIKKRL
jgi:hypothetical protein